MIERWFHEVRDQLVREIARDTTLRGRLRRVAVIFWSGQIGDYQTMQHDALQNLPKARRRQLYTTIHNSVVEPILGVMRDAISSGELPSDTNAYALVQLYSALVDGLSGLYNRSGEPLPPPEANVAPIELFVVGARALNHEILASWPGIRPLTEQNMPGHTGGE